MKKFILRFNHFNKMHWRRTEQNKPRLFLKRVAKERTIGKTMTTQACIEYIYNSYNIYHKNFITRFEKIDKWRKKHKRKNII